jgi:hypothetical protein
MSVIRLSILKFSSMCDIVGIEPDTSARFFCGLCPLKCLKKYLVILKIIHHRYYQCQVYILSRQSKSD